MYCAASDVLPLLGDLILPTTLDMDAMITKASNEITLYLGSRYEIPIPLTDDFTVLLLQEATSELTAALIIASQAQGGEDNRVNAYGKWLYDRAQERIRPYMCDLSLPDAVVRPSGSTLDGPVAVFNIDSVSPVESFYRYIQQPPQSPYVPVYGYE